MSLARTMFTLAAQLDGIVNRPQTAPADAFADSSLTTRVSDFGSHWSWQLQHVTDRLSDIASLLGDAARSYKEFDEQLAQAEGAPAASSSPAKASA